MKELLAVAAIVLGVFLIYHVHTDRVRNAAEAAKAENLPQKRQETLSQVLARDYEGLFAKMEHRRPADLVPSLKTIRQRVAIKRQNAVAARQHVYDAGLRAIDLTLETVVRIAAQPPPPLEAHKRGENSNTFFLQSAMKRWDSIRDQRKAAVDQALEQLYRAEAELNRVLGPGAATEDFDLGNLTTTYIRAEAREAGTLDRRP
jgi:hypothetical protein